MAKQLNVNLAFTADAGRAKAELQNLQGQLTSLLNLTNQTSNFKLTDEIREASVAVANLKLNLENATNVNTGKLDLGKFQQSMKASNMSIEKYQQSLAALGPTGEQSFVQLANSISRAEMPLRTTSTLVSNLWVTLKNTARWQLSSSVLHGFMGALQSSYGYAQDLNESLNNIRIVTGYGADEMAKFAVEANNAARALSTTTTAYTNASLIFYQQGLNADEVKERTDITIKLANVARQSVEQTSDQLTAIWNNFAKEGDNLERYADVLTALGAATASSTDEIAGGLEKFAAVADMIGLSYDYAASSLATLTATTRQSEEVVGTALKTIFARIQGLNLGETLDDGTTLNKYSEALDKIGVSIYDQSGGLKSMDAILNEMGSKWQDLNKAQQVALAQTVAGVRQYNQLVSLMENWDYMQQNLDVAQMSTGELTNQANIYAESWEAASKRVSAAAEDIFDSLLEDEFFITLLNGIEDVLNGVGFLIDSAGGLEGAMASLGAILFSVFGPQLATAFNNAKLNILSLTKEGKAAAIALRVEAQQAVIDMYDKNMTKSADAHNVATAAAEKEVAVERAKLQKELILNGETLTDQEKETLALLLDQNEALGQQVINYAKIQDAARRRGSDALGELSFDLSTDDFDADLTELQTSLEDLARTGETGFKAYADAFQNATLSNGRSMKEHMLDLGWSEERINEATHNMANSYRSMGQATKDGDLALENFKKNANDLSDDINNGIPSLKSFGDTFVAIGQSVSQISMGIFSLSSAFNTISNSIQEGKFSLQDFLSILTSMGMALPMIISGLKNLSNAKVKDSIVTGLNTMAERASAKAKEKSEKAAKKAAAAQKKETEAQKQDIAVNVAQAGSEKTLSASKSGGAPADGGASGSAVGALTKGGASMLGAIAAIAAGIAIITGAIVWAVDQATQAEQALERAQETAAELSQLYDSTKNAHEEFKQSVSNYSAAIESLEDLTEGTQEYAEAVFKANELASELLDTYNNLKYSIEDGQIVIDASSLEQAQADKQTITERAYAAKVAAQRDVSFKEAELQKRDLARDVWSSRDTGMTLANIGSATAAGAGGGALIGTGIGAIFGGIGAAPGAAAGAIIGAVSGLITGIISTVATGISNEAEKEAFDKLKEAQLKDDTIAQKLKDGTLTDADWDKIGIEDEALRKALIDNGNAVADLIVEMAENTAAIDAQNDLVASQILSNNKKVQQSEYRNEIIDITGDSYGNVLDDILETADWRDTWGKKGIAQIDGANKEAQKVFDEYLKYAGLENEGYKLTDTTGNDNKRKFVYKDREGNTQEITLDAMQAARAAYEASQELDEQAADLAKKFEALSKSTDDADQAFLSFLSTKNFEQANKSEFQDLRNGLGVYQYNDGTTDYRGYLSELLGTELTDEVAAQYGYKSAQAMIDSFAAELDNMKIAWDALEIPDDLLGVSQLSFETSKALSDLFYDLNLGPLGEKAGEEFTAGLNKMIKGLSIEDQEKALKQLSAIDWSAWDALEKADLIMQAFGVDIDTASAEWVAFANNMRLASNATPDYTTLKQTLMDVTAIIADLDFGSIIEDEDYEKLIKYNDAWKEFFILQADGSRKFIGDSEDMMAQTRAQIIEDRKALQERQKVQAEWKTVVWGSSRGLADWSTKSGSEVGTARNLMKDSGKTEKMLELLGYTDERIQEMLTQAESADAEIKKVGQEAIEKMYRAMADFTEEDLVQAEVDLNEMMASTAVDLIELQALLASNQISAEAYDKQLHYLIESQAEATQSLSELKDLMGSLQSAGESMDYETYADNLIRLAEEYDNCAKEIKEYKRALANGDSVDEAEDALEASLMLAEAAEEYNLEAKELEVQSRQLAKAYNLTAAAAAKLAIQNQRMNKGIVTLAENWEEWNKALTDSDTTTTDFANALIDCTAAVADLVGASADLELPDDFFNAEHLALLEQAINGDINAINQLGFAVAETQIKALEFNAAFASLSQMMDPMGDTAYDEQSFDNDMQLIVDRLEALRTRTDQVSADMGQDWVDALNRMAKATGMSVDEMNQLLGTMGVQAKVKVDYVEQEMQIPTYTEVVEPGATVQVQQGVDENGNPRYVPYTGIKKYTVPGKPVTVTGYAAVAQISTEENPMEADIDEGAKPSGGSSGGGATWTGNRGSIAPSTAEKVKETKEKNAPKLKEAFEVDDDQFKSLDEEAERYHEINNELEVLADNLDSISKEKDRAYGANRVKLIDQETNALKKQLSVQERYIDEIEDYLEQDRAKMDKYGFMFNEDADIINYDEVMDQQIQAYNAAYQAYINAKNAAVAAYNAAVQSGTSEEDAEKIYDAAIKAADATWEAAQERYETFEKELRQYEESVDLLRQQQQVLQDIKYQIQDLNYEKIQYKLEVKMEINDAEMRMLDYYLNKLSDDFYSMAEAAQLMVDKVPLMTQALGNYESFYNEIEAAYAAGDISQADYVDGLKQSYDGILNNLEALQDLDKEMMHYYEDTLAAGQEELAHYTDRMEHLTSVLDHYHNLIVMINGEYDYDSIGTILEGKASTIKNELEVASANYEMLLEQQALIQSHYDNAIDENARALHAEELKAINAQVDEAHELMLAKTEEWAEAQKAIMENTMAKAAREMEMAFTNNMGFDALSNSLNRLSATADVYLTETNKIYETQTLINKAQKDIDKTTNNAAKIRLKNYQEEIELLQDKNKLTKVELDIAKAKYDVLLAEIALEEAQNAKSTVRLQRDNEGNYGYVYTADQSKVAEAEQNLLDTQNELYNIRLEAANEYGQKIMELNQQLADDLMALEQARVDGQFATEAEYQAAKERILKDYEAAYEAYASAHEAAIKEDTRIEQEAWVSAYSEIIDSADNWQYKVNEYTDKCEDAYRDYRNTVSTESDVINRLLNDVEGAVKDVTKESDNLKNKVKNEVIPQIRDQYTKVANVTAAYAAQRTGILQLIQTYEQLAASILKAMQAQANLNALEETPTGPTVPNTQTQEKPVDTKQPTEDPSAQEKARAKAIALEAQEIVTRVHTGAIPMHSSGLGWQPSAREQGYSEEAIKVALQAFNDSKPGAGWDYYYDIALDLASRYNTGGYTGAWGPYGKMAILDEKELVLNKHDTENFLMATEILRSIVDIIDFNSLHNQMSWLSSTGFASAGAGPLEQSVSIEAHFPNVSDRNEIEEAFNNLINTASQYANRKF